MKLSLFILLLTVTNCIQSEASFSAGNEDCSGERQFYKAAVVEYEADKNNAGLTSEEILLLNVDIYEEIIRQASSEATDIIVFPEYGLTTLLAFSKSQLQYIPDVGVNPCEDLKGNSEVIRRLSCAAKFGFIYLVINLGEVTDCSSEIPSPGSGSGPGPEPSSCTLKEERRQYNTAVAFGRDGRILAKYRKTHLFAEPDFVSPEIPSLSTFTTDFGVEFGIFICFDILFEFPAKELVRRGVKHFIFPTAWIDELPFLTAVQAQMFWASSSNVTLLGAGYHLPKFGKLGSGIFLPSGQALNYTSDSASGTRVIYAQVPIHENYLKYMGNLQSVSGSSSSSGSELLGENTKFTKQRQKESRVKITSFENVENVDDDDRFYYREDLKNYTAVTIPLSYEDESAALSLCDKDFCCSVTYRHKKLSSSSVSGSSVENIIAGDSNENFNDDIPLSIRNESLINYKLIVFNQTRKFTSPSVTKTMHLQICGIVRCLNESIQSCAEAENSMGDGAGDLKQSGQSAESVVVVDKVANLEMLPSFDYFKLSSSNFVVQQNPKLLSWDDDDGDTIADADVAWSTRPGFNTLDSNFNLIPAHLFNVVYSDGKGGSGATATLSSDRIQSFQVQTLAVIHRVF